MNPSKCCVFKWALVSRHWTAKGPLGTSWVRNGFHLISVVSSRSLTACAWPAPAPLRGSALGWSHRFPQQLWLVVYWRIPSPWPALSYAVLHASDVTRIFQIFHCFIIGTLLGNSHIFCHNSSNFINIYSIYFNIFQYFTTTVIQSLEDITMTTKPPVPAVPSPSPSLRTLRST